VESFRPGVLERLGIGYDALRRRNPKIILCSLSGYGQKGPLRERAGHDLNYMALAGVLSLSTAEGGDPQAPGIQLADVAGGAMHGAIGVLAALLACGRDGEGRHLDISLTRGAMAFAGFEISRRSVGVKEPHGHGMLTGGLPCYRVYRTADGRHMALGALEPKFFEAFVERVGAPELKGRGYDGSEEVFARLREIFASRSQAEWVTFLRGVDCCCEPVRTPEEALEDGALGHHKINADGVTALLSDVGFAPKEDGDLRAPTLGEHNGALTELFPLDPEVVAQAEAGGAFSRGGK